MARFGRGFPQSTQWSKNALEPAGVTHNAEAALSVVASLTPAAVATYAGAAAFNEVTSLTPVAKLTANALAALAEETTLAPTAQLTANALAALQASATVTPGATANYAAASALSATATLTPAARVDLFALALLQAAVTISPTAESVKAGAALLEAIITLSATGEISGFHNAEASLQVAATLAAAARADYAAEAALQVSASLSADAYLTLGAQAALEALASLAAAANMTRLAEAALQATATLAAEGVLITPGAASLVTSVSLSPNAMAILGAAAGFTATATVTPAAKLNLAGASTLGVVVTIAPLGGLVHQGASALTVVVSLSGVAQLRTLTNENRWWAVWYDGATQDGYVPRLIRGRTVESVNKIGYFEFETPASSEIVNGLRHGREVAIYFEPEGEVMRGRVVSKEISDQGGAAVLKVHGLELGVELEWANMYYGTTANNNDPLFVLDSIFDNLVSEYAWDAIYTGTGFQNITMQWGPMSVWRAALSIAESQSGYLRRTTTSRQIELKRGTTDSGIRLLSTIQMLNTDYPNTGIINGLPLVRYDSSEMINRIIPVGVDNGEIAFDLRRSSRSSPYTIQTYKPAATRFPIAYTATSTAGPGIEANTNFEIIGDNMSVYAIFAFDAGNEDAPETVKLNGREWDTMPTVEISAGGTSKHVRALFWDKVKAGKATLTWTFGAGSASGTYSLVVALLSGVDSLDSLADEDSSSGTSTTPTTTVTCEVGDLILSAMRYASTPTVTPTGGQTVYFSGTGYTYAYKYAVSTSETISYTLSTSQSYALDTWVIRPYKAYYLEDSTSSGQYELRQKFMAMNSQRPIGPTEIQAAANTLYDRAVNELVLAKDGISSYQLDVAYLPATGWLPGDSMRLIYKGPVRGDDHFLDIDDNLIVLERARNFDESGMTKWDLTLANVYRYPVDLGDILYDKETRLSDLEK